METVTKAVISMANIYLLKLGGFLFFFTNILKKLKFPELINSCSKKLIANETKFKVVSILITSQAWICFIWKAKLKWILSLHCLGTLQKGDCKWAHQILGGRGTNISDTHIDALSYSAWLDLSSFVVCVEPPSKMEPGHSQRRFHQGGISGGTNVDVPELFWRMKPSRAGESWLQCDASTDRRHTDVAVITAMQHWRESSSKWPFISHERGTKNGIDYSRSPLFTFSPNLWL